MRRTTQEWPKHSASPVSPLPPTATRAAITHSQQHFIEFQILTDLAPNVPAESHSDQYTLQAHSLSHAALRTCMETCPTKSKVAATHLQKHQHPYSEQQHCSQAPLHAAGLLPNPNQVGGERTTCASTASSLNLRRANARRPLTHEAQPSSPAGPVS
jgi:hypothetical protein